jgi:hypothetical protein
MIRLWDAFGPQGFETGWAAMHSTGSSRDDLEPCGTRIENDAARVAKRIRDLRAADFPALRTSEKIWNRLGIRSPDQDQRIVVTPRLASGGTENRVKVP